MEINERYVPGELGRGISNTRLPANRASSRRRRSMSEAMLRSITEASAALALAEFPRLLFGCWEVRSAICTSGGGEPIRKTRIFSLG
jgi:hypothetical protein